MTLIEFIGFIISLAAMIFLVVKRFWEDSQRRRYPEKYAEADKKKEKILHELMRSLELKREESDEGEEDDEDEDEELEVRPRKPISRRPPPLALPAKKMPLPTKKPHSLDTTRQSLDKLQLRNTLDDHYGQSTNEKRFLKNSMSDSYREEISSDTFLKGELAAYDIVKQRRSSRASEIINALPSPKNMLIIKEIFGPPKGLRINPWDE